MITFSSGIITLIIIMIIIRCVFIISIFLEVLWLFLVFWVQWFWRSIYWTLSICWTTDRITISTISLSAICFKLLTSLIWLVLITKSNILLMSFVLMIWYMTSLIVICIWTIIFHSLECTSSTNLFFQNTFFILLLALICIIILIHLCLWSLSMLIVVSIVPTTILLSTSSSHNLLLRSITTSLIMIMITAMWLLPLKMVLNCIIVVWLWSIVRFSIMMIILLFSCSHK